MHNYQSLGATPPEGVESWQELYDRLNKDGRLEQLKDDDIVSAVIYVNVGDTTTGDPMILPFFETKLVALRFQMIELRKRCGIPPVGTWPQMPSFEEWRELRRERRAWWQRLFS